MKFLLKEVAKQRGWSIYKVAHQLNIADYPIGIQNVYDWANGRSMPTYENLKALCEVLECSSVDLLGW